MNTLQLFKEYSKQNSQILLYLEKKSKPLFVIHIYLSIILITIYLQFDFLIELHRRIIVSQAQGGEICRSVCADGVHYNRD